MSFRNVIMLPPNPNHGQQQAVDPEAIVGFSEGTYSDGPGNWSTYIHTTGGTLSFPGRVQDAIAYLEAEIRKRPDQASPREQIARLGLPRDVTRPPAAEGTR